jgi:hypothetical protein
MSVIPAKAGIQLSWLPPPGYFEAWRSSPPVRLIDEMNPDWRDLHDEIDILTTLVEE